MSVRMSVPSKSTARGRGFSSCVTHRGGLASPVNASPVSEQGLALLRGGVEQQKQRGRLCAQSRGSGHGESGKS